MKSVKGKSALARAYGGHERDSWALLLSDAASRASESQREIVREAMSGQIVSRDCKAPSSGKKKAKHCDGA